MQDLYGRFINTLRISVTNECNLKCYYCYDKSTKKNKLLKPEEIENIVYEASLLGINRIKLTGGECLLRKDIIEIIKKIKKNERIIDLSITTNGILLKKYAKRLKIAGLDRVNISLDALDKNLYKKITINGNLNLVLEGIFEAKNVGLYPIKINSVLLKNTNETEIEKIKDFCKNNNFQFQLINQMKLTEHKMNFDNFKTQKPPLCNQCNRIRLTSDGYLLPCLFNSQKIDIKNFDSIKDALIYCINSKPKNGTTNTNLNMKDIGG